MPEANDNKQESTSDTSLVIAGGEKLLDDQVHYGLAVKVASDGKPCIVMIPDVTAIEKGAPVYITGPITISGQHLKKLLEKTHIPDNIKTLIEDTSIACDAFYYTKTGPQLMKFALKFNEGLIKDLTGSEELANLFEVKSAELRVFKCKDEKAFGELKQYAALLAKE